MFVNDELWPNLQLVRLCPDRSSAKRVYSTSITTHRPIIRLRVVTLSVMAPEQTSKQRHCFATCSCRDDLILYATASTNYLG